MTLTPRHGDSDLSADPFGERVPRSFTLCQQVLGGRFVFESDSEALLRLVEAAYGGLAGHVFPGDGTEFHIELRLLPARNGVIAAEPPPVQAQSGAGLLCGVMDACNYLVIAPGQRRALVVVSEDMLSQPYYVRYELIEFAVFTLATRGLGLVPLHGACVGLNGRGVLLLGASGSGKSTLALHSLLGGLDFLAEDAVFVQPDSLLATGVANYLHVKADALHFVDDEQARQWIASAPVIRRRSGVDKYEPDLRQGRGALAAAPLVIAGAVFVSSEPGDSDDALLRSIPSHEVTSRLVADQPYASGQPGWPVFAPRLAALGLHELRRGSHPRASVNALRQLLRHS